MKRTGKRLLALLLLLTMCLSLFPSLAFAEEGDPDAPAPTEVPAPAEEPEPTDVPAPSGVPAPTDEPAEPTPPPDPRDDAEPEDEMGELEPDPDAEIEATVASGACGDNLTWNLDDAGTLTISGSGDMWDYSGDPLAPLFGRRSSILSVVIEPGVTSVGDRAFYRCDNLTSVTIPEGVTSIGEGAFLSCYSLTSVTIPESVTSIGGWAFSDCSSLTEIYVDNANPSYSSENGILYNKAMTTLIQYPGGRSGSVTIREGVISIGRRAFECCDSLTSVTIPGSVTSIGRWAFDGCSRLSDVYYAGTADQWASISIEINNDPLLNATIHYEEPTPIIIPGIMGSKLYLDKACNEIAWGNLLALFSAGQNLRYTKQLYTRRNTKGNGLFLESQENKEYGTIDTYEVLVDSLTERFPTRKIYFFSYDWRKSNQESAEVLAEALSDEGIDRAVFLCHSMGGLVITNFIANGNQDKIEKVITFGTPYEGAPRLLQAMLTNTALDDTPGWNLDWMKMLAGNIVLFFSGLSYDTKHELPGLAELTPNILYNQSSPRTIDFYVEKRLPDYSLVMKPAPSLPKLFGSLNELKLWAYNPVSLSPKVAKQKATVKAWMEEVEAINGPLSSVEVSDFEGVLTFTPYVLCRSDYRFALSSIFDTNHCTYSDVSLVMNNVQEGIRNLQYMDNAFFVIGDIKKTMSGATLIQTHNGTIIFADSSTLPVGDGTVPFASANQYASGAINNRVRYFDLDHSGLVGYGEQSEWPLVRDWVFSIIDGNMRTDLGSPDPRVSSDGRRVKMNVDCPVEVTVTRSGESLSSRNALLSEEASFGTLDLGGENGEIKIFNLDPYGDYEILIEGTDEGTMDYTLSFYDEGNNLTEERSISAVPITADTVITTDADPSKPSALAVDSDGDGVTDKTLLLSTSDKSFTPIALSQNYLLMAQGQTTTLDTALALEALAPSIRWAAADADGILFEADPILTVDEQTGEITALREGTAYVYAYFDNGSEYFYDRCRVDVSAVDGAPGEEPPGEGTEPSPAAKILYASLPEKKLSLELFSTDYARFDVLLELEQLRNPASAASLRPEAELPVPEDHGFAIDSARFQDEAVAALFDLRAADDRTLIVVPKYETLEQAAAKPSAIKGSYSSAVVVTVDGQDFVTQDAAGKPVKLTLTVGKTQPKLKAAELKFNSFLANQELPLRFTGGQVTAIARDEVTAAKNAKKDAESWLEVDYESQTARLRDGVDGKQSGNLYLTLTLDGWAVTQQIAVKVSAARTVPKLKLKSSSLTLLPGTEDRVTVPYTLSPALFDGRQPEVTRIVEAGKNGAAFENGEYVLCTVGPDELALQAPHVRDDELAHSYKVYLGLDGYEFPSPITVKTLKPDTAPVLSAKAGGAIDTAIPMSPVTLKLSLKNYHLGSGEQYSIDVRQQRAAKGASAAVDRSVSHLLNIEIGKGVITLTERVPGSLESGYTYTAILSAEIGGVSTKELKVKLNVKWSNPDKIKVSGSLKASGKLDPVRSETSILLTPSFKNCFGCEPKAADLAFYRSYKDPQTKKTVTVPADDFFRAEEEGGSFRIWLTPAAAYGKADKFKVELHFAANGGSYVTPQIVLPVKVGSVKLSASPAAVSLLANDRYSTGAFRIASADPALSGISAVTLDSKSAELFELVDLGQGSYSLAYRGHLVPAAAKAGKSFSVKLTVLLKGAPADQTQSVSVKVNIR